MDWNQDTSIKPESACYPNTGTHTGRIQNYYCP